MDLTLPVIYRGITLNAARTGPGPIPVSGVRLTQVKYSDVSVHGYTEKKSLSDGMDASDVYMGQRNVDLVGEVFAQNKGDLFDYIDQLRLKFTPTDAYAEDPDKRGYLPLWFQIPTKWTSHWPTGITDRVLYVRPRGQPDHTIEFRAIGGRDNDGFVVPFSVSLEAKDPRFYHPWSKDHALAGGGGQQSYVNRGNYYAPMHFILKPAVGYAGQGSFHYSGVGSNFDCVVPGAASADRYVRIDSINKVVTYTINDVETLRMDLIKFNAGTTWPQVPPTPEGVSPAGGSWHASGLGLDGAISRAFFNETWA